MNQLKKLLFCVLLSFSSLSNGQLVLPIDFEIVPITADFIDFDGGKGTVISNPAINAQNQSTKVAQIIRQGGQIWAGSKLRLKDNLNFTQYSQLTMKVFTTAPIGTTIKLKLEGQGTTERDVITTKSNEWESLTWDFTGSPDKFNELVFMFDFGKIGNGTDLSTFLFDDIMQLYSGKQINLPVNFEDSTINYTMTDFGGNQSTLVADPEDANNHVIKVLKSSNSATWAGTTIGTQGGFTSNIPLSLASSKMNVMVWSPEAGTPIRLKVEDYRDPTHTCETQTNTKFSKKWEIVEFDFKNQAMGTELLSVGLSKGWTYNKASIFFNFGTEGATSGEKTYYFDNVKFGSVSTQSKDSELNEDVKAYPNPTYENWYIDVKDKRIDLLEIFDLSGKLLKSIVPNEDIVIIDSNDFGSGVYLLKSSFSSKIEKPAIIRLVKLKDF